MLKSNSLVKDKNLIVTYIGFYLLFQLILMVYRFISLMANTEIISINFEQQHIIGISPYMELTDIVIVPMMIVLLVIIGLFRDIYQWRSIFTFLVSIALLLIVSRFNTLVVGYLLIPLSMAVFCLTLTSCVKLVNHHQAIRLVFILYGLHIFSITLLWQIFYSKTLLHIQVIEHLSDYLYILCYFILVCLVIFMLFSIISIKKIRSLSNLMVQFLIASLRFPIQSLNAGRLLLLLLVCTVIQFSRFLNISLVEDLNQAFDIQLILLLILQLMVLAGLSWLGYRAICQKQYGILKWVNISYISFVVLLFIVSQSAVNHSLVLMSMFYINKAFSLGYLAFYGAAFISTGIVFDKRNIGFQISILFIVISVIWRVAFFIADAFSMMLGIGI